MVLISNNIIPRVSEVEYSSLNAYFYVRKLARRRIFMAVFVTLISLVMVAPQVRNFFEITLTFYLIFVGVFFVAEKLTKWQQKKAQDQVVCVGCKKGLYFYLACESEKGVPKMRFCANCGVEVI